MQLYYGNNGQQAFYESEDHRVLIFRVLSERWWQLWINGKPKGSATTITKLIKNKEFLFNGESHTLRLDGSKTWKKVNQYAMRLS